MELQQDKGEVLVGGNTQRREDVATPGVIVYENSLWRLIRLILTSFLTGCSHVRWSPSADWSGSPSLRRNQATGDKARGVEDGLQARGSSHHHAGF